MAIVSPPKLGHPYWTAYSPAEGDSSPVDPLRFETYAERLGNHLFPGITNRVERVRYFGMVCAGIEAAAAEIGRRRQGADPEHHGAESPRARSPGDSVSASGPRA